MGLVSRAPDWPMLSQAGPVSTSAIAPKGCYGVPERKRGLAFEALMAPRLFIGPARWLAPDSGLTSTERLVIAVLGIWTNSERGDCYPSVATISAHSGFSERTVQGALLHLSAIGAIDMRPRFALDGTRMTNLYTVLGFDPTEKELANAALVSRIEDSTPQQLRGGTPQMVRGGTPQQLHPNDVVRNTTTTTTTTTPAPAPKSALESDFAQLWTTYPKRAGGNNKAVALRAYLARRKSGVQHDELLAGVVRYAAFVRSEGNEGSKFVKQATTFLGPDEHWREPWEPAAPDRRDDPFDLAGLLADAQNVSNMVLPGDYAKGRFDVHQ